MESRELHLKDTRVPTFIQFPATTTTTTTTTDMDNNNTTKKVTKRKRTAATENTKPAKRKAGNKKLAAASSTDSIGKNGSLDVPPSEEIQVWIGAAINDNNEEVAYSIYYGENDTRNSIEIIKRENELQDLDYAYVLGTLKAIESFKILDKTNSLIVNTSCRELPRAITSTKSKNVFHQDKISIIRELMNENKHQDIQVRHVSGRTSSIEHKTAIKTATIALENSNPSKEEQQVQEEEKLIEEVQPNVIDQVDELIIAQQQETKTAVETKVETKEEKVTMTTVETKVETKEENVTINEEDENMEQQVITEQPEQQKPTTSWLGNLLDVLYAPFRSKNQ